MKYTIVDTTNDRTKIYADFDRGQAIDIVKKIVKKVVVDEYGSELECFNTFAHIEDENARCEAMAAEIEVVVMNAKAIICDNELAHDAIGFYACDLDDCYNTDRQYNMLVDSLLGEAVEQIEQKLHSLTGKDLTHDDVHYIHHAAWKLSEELVKAYTSK